MIRLLAHHDEIMVAGPVLATSHRVEESLLEYDVALDVRLNSKMHDREVRLGNGWTIKIGRGLDFYQKPEGWYAVGATDLSLRRCLETKVDAFRSRSAEGSAVGLAIASSL